MMMMTPSSSFRSSEVDQLDRLHDSLLLIILNKVADIKSLGRCFLVSRRFHSLIPQVQYVVVRVDCVISDDDDDNPVANSLTSSGKAQALMGSGGHTFAGIFRMLISNIWKPIQTHFFMGHHNKKVSSLTSLSSSSSSGITHHSPTQVLKNFNEIKSLKIELPSGELCVDDGVILKWKAHFGSTLDHCVILGASSVEYPNKDQIGESGIVSTATNNCNDNGSIPESFYTNGGLKLRVVWTISSLIAASARHYLLQPIIAEHETLDSLVLTDSDNQGVLCMNREQLDELRVKPLSASSASKRTLVPALNMRLWYAPELVLPDGGVLKGATLVAIRPRDLAGAVKKEVSDVSWVSDAFEEPYGTAARMLAKRRTYCLEMNSF